MRVVFVMVAAWGCAGESTGDVTSETTDTATEPSVPLPDYAAPGPFAAGTRKATIDGSDGTLTLQVWYPTLDETGDLVTYDGLVDGDAFKDASVACDEVRPLVAFSHGSGGIRFQSPFLTEHLATHGWMVVAPDHPGNTFLDGFPDFVSLVSSRPRDVTDAMDWFEAEVGDATSDFAGCTDPSAGYATAGHSFGGYTAMALAGGTVIDPVEGAVDFGDPRVFAVLPLAPWDVGGILDDGTADIDVPTLIMTGELDATTPIDQVRRMWDPMQVEPRWLAVFPEGGHLSFSPIACGTTVGDGCGAGFLDIDVLTDHTRHAAAAFLDGARGVSGAYGAMPLDATELDWEAVEAGR